MFSVQVTMCFLPTLLFCAPRHLGWGSGDSSEAWVKDAAARRGDGHPQVSRCQHAGPPQQRLWVWHWGEMLSTAPLFNQGAGSGRAGGLWFPGAHPATLWTSTYRRKTTNKWRNCSSEEICQLCFKKFKITVSALALRKAETLWKGHAYTHQQPWGMLIAEIFWLIYFTKCTRNFLSLFMMPNCSSCEI